MRVTAIIGYARVSTTGQDLDAQRAALIAAGVDPARVFTDKLSGSVKTARPGLAAMLDYARAGDTVVVAAIDRLGRSVAEVTRTIATLGERRITLRALREGIDKGSGRGRPPATDMIALPLVGRKPAHRHALLERHRPRVDQRQAPRDGLGIDVGDLELPTRRRRRRAPADHTQARHGKSSLPAGPAPRLQNRNLCPNSPTTPANQPRTPQPSPNRPPPPPCLVQLKIARDAPRLLRFAI